MRSGSTVVVGLGVLPAAGLAAGLAQDVAAERDDQAGLLGERHELGGRHEAADRVLPAHERLRGDDPAGVERDDRLVLDDHLLALDRLRQLLLEVVAAQDRGGHLRLEELEARLALGLRLVHGDVGVADQLVAVAAALLRAGEADGEMDADELRAGLDGQLEGLQDAARDGAAVDQRVADAGEHDRELVAAEAGDRVLGAHAGAQALGH